MSKTKKEEAVETEAVPEVAEPKVVVTVKTPEKRITFEAYAARRGVKDSHKRGMRAHVKNIGYPRTAAEWDTLFKNY